jgi:hypothetical protein
MPVATLQLRLSLLLGVETAQVHVPRFLCCSGIFHLNLLFLDALFL